MSKEKIADQWHSGETATEPGNTEDLSRLHQLLDQLPDGYLVISRDWVYTHVNAPGAALVGLTPEQMVGQQIWELFPEAVNSAFYLDAQQALSEGMALSQENYYPPLGKWYLNRIIPCPEGLAIFFTDITPYKKLENELRMINLALKSKEHELNATNQNKYPFLKNITHEIYTPINAIIGFSYLIEKEPLTKKQTEYIKKIQTSATQLTHILANILDFSKIESHQISLKIHEFNLSRMVEHVCYLLSEKMQSKDLMMKVDLNDVPQTLLGDELRIEQVLINLLNNAVKFTDQGQIQLRIHRVENQQDSLRVRFEIEDTGIGMSPDQVAHIFNPYEQADSSNTRRYGGIGLGLAISQQLVKLMDGQIGVTSYLGKGSCFWFELPLKPGLNPIMAKNTVQKQREQLYQEASQEPFENFIILNDSAFEPIQTKLKALLNHYDAEANELFEKYQETFIHYLGHYGIILGSQIKAFDYEGALKTLQKFSPL